MSYSDTAIHVTTPAKSSIFEILHTRFRNWKTRNQMRAISDFDDRMLQDIGVTYEEVIWASKLPLAVNSAHEMDRISRARRRTTNSRPTFTSMI